MASQTSMLHVRVDDALKTQAAEVLAGVGLTLSDAVRILLSRVTKEGGLPAGLAVDADAYPPVAHQQVMDEAQTMIDRKRRART